MVYSVSNIVTALAIGSSFGLAPMPFQYSLILLLFVYIIPLQYSILNFHLQFFIVCGHIYFCIFKIGFYRQRMGSSLVTQMVKNPSAVQET